MAKQDSSTEVTIKKKGDFLYEKKKSQLSGALGALGKSDLDGKRARVRDCLVGELMKFGVSDGDARQWTEFARFRPLKRDDLFELTTKVETAIRAREENVVVNLASKQGVKLAEYQIDNIIQTCGGDDFNHPLTQAKIERLIDEHYKEQSTDTIRPVPHDTTSDKEQITSLIDQFKLRFSAERERLDPRNEINLDQLVDDILIPEVRNFPRWVEKTLKDWLNNHGCDPLHF